LISPAICETVHALPIYFWTISIAQEDKQAGHHLLQSVVMLTCVIFMHLVLFFFVLHILRFNGRILALIESYMQILLARKEDGVTFQ